MQIEIKPSPKYDAVYGTEHNINTDDRTESSARVLREEYEKEYSEQVEAVQEVCHDTDRRAEEANVDRENLVCLTWSDVAPPNDPDLLTVMATYYNGVEQSDPSELIRAKLRLGDVEWMANAQLAAREELSKPLSG